MHRGKKKECTLCLHIILHESAPNLATPRASTLPHLVLDVFMSPLSTTHTHALARARGANGP